ncbi:MAG: Uncharacterised protein [Polaribacter sejongensis]|nr:MAG: Uncharacterised protein [Polaribacter sejongensis]
MKQILPLLLSVILFSCGNNKKNYIITTQEKPALSVAKLHVAIENIQPVFEEKVASWQELKMVNSFLKKFKNVSPKEALSNALELRDLVVNLKDSLKAETFDIPSFNARVNLLHTETLRLADLTLIPAITSEEVHLQIDKTIAAFSAVNSKINTLLSKKKFEDEIDVTIDFIGIDSSKMDFVSKESIILKGKSKRKKKFLKNRN